MPRIPEGNFKTTPSLNVNKPALGAFDSREVVGRLKQLGGEFKKEADALEKKQQRAADLKLATDAEAEADAFGFEQEKILKSSVDGQVTGEDGKKIPTSQAVSREAHKRMSQATAKLGHSPVALALFNSSSRPKYERGIKQARRVESKQQVDSVGRGLVNKLNVYKQSIIDDTVQEGDLENLKAEAQISQPVMGSQYVANFNRQANNITGASASEYIKARDNLHPEHEAKAFKMVGRLPKGQQELAKRTLERTIEAKKKQEVRNADLNAAILLKNLDSPKAWENSAVVVGETSREYHNSGLIKFESAEQRITKMSGLQAKIITSGVILENPSATAAEMELRTELAVEDYITQFANANIYKEVSLQEMGKALRAKVEMDIAKNMAQRSGKFMGEYIRTQRPDLHSDLSSNSPDRKRQAIEDIKQHYHDIGIRENDIVIGSPSIAKDVAKGFKDINDNGDRDGTLGWGLVTDRKSYWGATGAQQAAKDLVKLNGKIPPIFELATLIDNPIAGKQVMADFANMNNNIIKAAEKQNETPKSIRSQLTDRLNKMDFKNIYGGGSNQNDGIGAGYRQAIESRAAYYMGQGINASKAVKTAQLDFSGIARVIQTKHDGIVVDSQMADVGSDEISALMDSATKLKGLNKVGLDVSISGLKLLATPQNPRILAVIQNLENAENLPYEERAALLLNTFGDNIKMYNDPDGSNTGVLMLKFPNSKPIPLPRDVIVDGEAKHETLKVNMLQYKEVIDTDRAVQDIQNQRELERGGLKPGRIKRGPASVMLARKFMEINFNQKDSEEFDQDDFVSADDLGELPELRPFEVAKENIDDALGKSISYSKPVNDTIETLLGGDEVDRDMATVMGRWKTTFGPTLALSLLEEYAEWRTKHGEKEPNFFFPLPFMDSPAQVTHSRSLDSFEDQKGIDGNDATELPVEKKENTRKILNGMMTHVLRNVPEEMLKKSVGLQDLDDLEDVEVKVTDDKKVKGMLDTKEHLEDLHKTKKVLKELIKGFFNGFISDAGAADMPLHETPFSPKKDGKAIAKSFPKGHLGALVLDDVFQSESLRGRIRKHEARGDTIGNFQVMESEHKLVHPELENMSSAKIKKWVLDNPQKEQETAEAFIGKAIKQVGIVSNKLPTHMQWNKQESRAMVSFAFNLGGNTGNRVESLETLKPLRSKSGKILKRPMQSIINNAYATDGVPLAVKMTQFTNPGEDVESGLQKRRGEEISHFEPELGKWMIKNKKTLGMNKLITKLWREEKKLKEEGKKSPSDNKELRKILRKIERKKKELG